MNYDSFIGTWLGRSIDWDGQYGPQCVDLAAQYCQENNRPIAYANAANWWGNPALVTGFDFVPNDVGNPDQVPNRGEIIIWSSGLPNSGGYGHIAIFDMVTGPHSFQSLDQNWGGQYVHFQPHNWSYVLGWLHPRDNVALPAPEHQPDPAEGNIDPELPAAIIPVLPEPLPPPSLPTPTPTGALPITSPRYEQEIVKQIPAYETMTDAQNQVNPTDVVNPGVTYYLRTSQGGMDKLATDSNGTNAIWINPALNVPDPTPEQVVKTSLEDIKKQWEHLTVSPVNTPVLVTPASPPLPTVADNSWRQMSPFITQAGKRIAREYRVVKAYQVTDLEGRTDKRVALIPGQRILIAGTFQKDGIKYFRPKKVADAGGWWGIPLVDPSGDDIIELDKALVFTVPTPDFVLTPQRKITITEALADGKAAFDKFESRFGLRVFDIFKGKNNRRTK